MGTSSITLTYNGVYSINYQTNTNINAGNYSFTFNNGLITLGLGGTTIDDNSYPTLKDESGNNITPTAWYKFDNSANIGLDTQTTYSMTNNGTLTTTSSSVKGSLASVYNGTTQYLSISNGVNLNTKSFSISVWIYPTDLTGNRWIYGWNGTQTSGSGNRGKYLYIVCD